ASLSCAVKRLREEPGVERAPLGRMVAPRAPDVLWDALLDELQKNGQLRLNGAWYHLPDHTVTLSASEAKRGEQIMQFAWEGRYNPTWIRDIAREIEADEQELRAIGRKLVSQGVFFLVVGDVICYRQIVIVD